MKSVSTQPEPKLARTPSNSSKNSLVIVIKIGTSSICDEKTFIPKLSILSLLVETIVHLCELGHQVVLVSSGAVGMGLRRLELEKKPKHISQIQAVAAVGQGRLMALYDSLFSQFHIPVAQVLLTRDTVSERGQYLNACNTFKELLSMKIIPIVNENDTVSHAELRFGDNDSLSAIAAGMVKADFLFLLTDVECLYTDNPRTNPDAKPIRVVRDIAQLKSQVNVSTPGSSVGTGGMVTKLIAAELASSAGCSTIITHGSNPRDILSILQNISPDPADSSKVREPSKGTYFVAQGRLLEDRKWWISHGLAPAGSLLVDAGATKAVLAKGSLFAVGIVQVEGTFGSQQSVKILSQVKDATGKQVVTEIGRGLVNYSSAELQRIKGRRSSEIPDLLGFCESEEVVHRNNLALLQG